MEKQIKSRVRVRTYGEVYTNQKEVTSMLNLVNNELSQIDTTVLEPACGNGNFLVEIMRRKINAALSHSPQDPVAAEYWLIRAISTIYGIDVIKDNIEETHSRLFQEFLTRFISYYHCYPSNQCQKCIQVILSQNIQCGDALSHKREDESMLVITQWHFDNLKQVTIHLFKYEDMVYSGCSCAPFYSLPTVSYVKIPELFQLKND